jgi:hypothetical protein
MFPVKPISGQYPQPPLTQCLTTLTLSPTLNITTSCAINTTYTPYKPRDLRLVGHLRKSSILLLTNEFDGLTYIRLPYPILRYLPCLFYICAGKSSGLKRPNLIAGRYKPNNITHSILQSSKLPPIISLSVALLLIVSLRLCHCELISEFIKSFSWHNKLDLLNIAVKTQSISGNTIVSVKLFTTDTLPIHSFSFATFNLLLLPE